MIAMIPAQHIRVKENHAKIHPPKKYEEMISSDIFFFFGVEKFGFHNFFLMFLE